MGRTGFPALPDTIDSKRLPEHFDQVIYFQHDRNRCAVSDNHEYIANHSRINLLHDFVARRVKRIDQVLSLLALPSCVDSNLIFSTMQLNSLVSTCYGPAKFTTILARIFNRPGRASS